MRWLLWLYPRAWRRRYGREMLALLEETGATWRVVLDCIWSAVEAHFDRELVPQADEPVVPAVAAATAIPAEPEARPVVAPRRPFWSLRPDGLETAIDQILSAAAAEGAFDNLRGAGQPLDLAENPFEGELATAFRMLRAAGETLPWIALGREIDAEEAQLAADLERATERLRELASIDPAACGAERARARRRYLERAAAIDRKLAEYGALIPHRQFDRGRLLPHVAAARFDATCPPPP
jgi:DnaJ family protein C protein 28